MGGPVSCMLHELFVFKGVWLRVILLNGLPTGIHFGPAGSQNCGHFTGSIRAFLGACVLRLKMGVSLCTLCSMCLFCV